MLAQKRKLENLYKIKTLSLFLRIEKLPENNIRLHFGSVHHKVKTRIRQVVSLLTITITITIQSIRTKWHGRNQNKTQKNLRCKS